MEQWQVEFFPISKTLHIYFCGKLELMQNMRDLNIYEIILFSYLIKYIIDFEGPLTSYRKLIPPLFPSPSPLLQLNLNIYKTQLFHQWPSQQMCLVSCVHKRDILNCMSTSQTTDLQNSWDFEMCGEGNRGVAKSSSKFIGFYNNGWSDKIQQPLLRKWRVRI